MGILGSSSGILSLFPDVDLTANTPYRITLDGPVPGDVTWNYNNQGAGGGLIFEDGEWTPSGSALGAIDIIGTTESAAPEPGTFPTLGAGCRLSAC